MPIRSEIRKAVGRAPLLDDKQVDGLRRVLLYMIRTDRDVSLRQLAILMLLTDPSGPRTVRHFAAFLRVGKPVISRAMDILSDMRLAERNRDPSDRRSVLLALTPLGAAVVECFAAEMTGAYATPGVDDLTGSGI